MPFNPDGSFSLLQRFGTGTPPSNDFPPQVGADFDDLASSLNPTSSNNPYTASIASLSSAVLLKANNLSDVPSPSTARANLGIVNSPIVLISTHTVSGGNIDFTSGIDSTYTKYRFELLNLLPVTGGGFCSLQVSTDNGSTWKNTSYADTGIITTSAGASGIEGYSGGASIALTSSGSNWSTDSTFGLCGHVELFTPSDSVTKKAILHEARYLDATGPSLNYKTGGGSWTGATTAVNAIRFTGTAASGLTSGTINLYGYT